MKKLLTIITLGLTTLVASAQTNFTGDLAKVGTDVTGFLTDSGGGTNWGATFGGLYNPTAKKAGGFLDVQYDISTYASVGIVTAYYDHTLYDGSIGFKLGTSLFTIPKLGALYVYSETGPGYNFRLRQAMVQSFAGGIFRFGKFDVGGGVGNISDQQGIFYTGHITYHW